MRLSTELADVPNKSQSEVFLEFVAELTRLQKQMDTTYHPDRFLRDHQLFTSVYVPEIQILLRDRIPWASEAAMICVAERLSGNKKTVGTSSAYIAKNEIIGDQTRCDDEEKENDPRVLYTLGQTYRGDAKRTMRTPWKMGQMAGDGRKRTSPEWLQGLKGCFVCGRENMARYKHPQDQIMD